MFLNGPMCDLLVTEIMESLPPVVTSTLRPQCNGFVQRRKITPHRLKICSRYRVFQ